MKGFLLLLTSISVGDQGSRIEDLKDLLVEANCLGNRQQKGDLREALRLCQIALVESRQAGSTKIEVEALLGITVISNRVGSPRESLMASALGLVMASESGDQVLEVMLREERIMAFQDLLDIPLASWEADKLWEAMKRSRIERGESYLQLGYVASMQGEREKAYRWYRRALSAARQTGNTEVAIDALVEIGRSRSRLDGKEEAASCFSQAQRLAHENGLVEKEARALAFWSQIEVGERAVALAKRCVDIARSGGHETPFISTLMTTLALAQRANGNLRAARATAHDALRRAKALAHPACMLEAMLELGRCELECRNWAATEAIIDEASALIERTQGDSRLHLDLVSLRAGLACETQPRNKLMDVVTNAIRLADVSGQNLRAQFYRLWAIDLMIEEGNTLEAKRELSQSWAVLRNSPQSEEWPLIVAEWTYHSARVGELELARKAVESLGVGPFSPLATMWINRARLELAIRSEDRVAAQAAYGALRDASVTTVREAPRPMIYGCLARAASELRLPEAIDWYEKALKYLDEGRYGHSLDRWKKAWTANARELYAPYVVCLLRFGRIERAIEVAEAAHARALLDLVEGRPFQKGQSESRSGIERTNEQAEANAGERGSAAARERIAQLPCEQPDMASPNHVAPLELMGITRLACHAMEVLYLFSPDGLAIFGIACERVPVGVHAWKVGQTLDQLVGETRSLLGRRNLSPDEADFLRQRLRKLYDLLISPLENVLPTAEGARVLIVPHGPLFLVPFDALIGPDGRFLCERFTVIQAPSISIARALGGSLKPATGAPLLMGNPLMPDRPLWPGLEAAGREVNEIAALLAKGQPRRHPTVLTGEAATEEAFRRLAPTASILHVATHGYADSIDPRRSVLVLAPTGPDPRRDGYVQIGDIMALRLQAQLVVLSACRSGLGPITAEGVAGFQRAFLAAGAGSLVASLWDVEDQPTARFMTLMHQEYAASGDIGRACRSARLAMIKEGYPPRAWAGFVTVSGVGGN